MQFALLIYQNWKWIEEGPSETEIAEIGKEYQDLGATPGLTSTVPLGHRKDAMRVRVQDGKTITSEGTVGGLDASVGSVYFFEAENKDAAIDKGRSRRAGSTRGGRGCPLRTSVVSIGTGFLSDPFVATV